MASLFGGSNALSKLSNVGSIAFQQVRYWAHGKGYNRKYKKWRGAKDIRKYGLEGMLATEHKKHTIFRRLLKEWKWIAWGHDTMTKPDKRLNYPL